jgi:hypothetical protein
MVCFGKASVARAAASLWSTDSSRTSLTINWQVFLCHRPPELLCEGISRLASIGTMRADGATGATVKFRGVKIGSEAQTRILLPPECALCETKSEDLRLPVVLKIEGPQLRSMGGSGAYRRSRPT